MIQKNNSPEVILGIDLGSGSLKAGLTDLEGRLLGRSQAAYPTQAPKPGWAQQDPNDWIAALETAVPDLLEKTGVAPERILCIGLCGAAHIPVLLDGRDRPTCPSILWSDCRSAGEVEYLEAALGGLIMKKTWNKVGCAWTLPQLVWLRNNAPEALDHATTFLTSKDYIAYWLTGEKACDVGSATATMMFDPKKGSWVEELIKETGLSGRIFPEVRESRHLVGKTTSRAARIGLASGIPVVLGCLDSVAEMIAVGGRSEYDCALRLGTAGGVLVLRRGGRYVPGLYNYPFPYDDLSILQAGTSCCGRSLEWIRTVFSARDSELSGSDSFRPGAEGLIFHPFLQGERAPYFNPDLRGSFIGLTTNHRREHLVQAVLEGVGFSLLDCLNSISNTGLPPKRIKVVGGGARIPVWMSILSNILDRELVPLLDADSSQGAAILAAEAFSIPETGRKADFHRREGDCFFPNRHFSKAYRELFEKYREIAAFLNEFYGPKNKKETVLETVCGADRIRV